MNKHATLHHAFFNERYRRREVPDQLLITGVRNRDHLVLHVLREEGLDTVCDLEDMGNIGVLQGLQI